MDPAALEALPPADRRCLLLLVALESVTSLSHALTARGAPARGKEAPYSRPPQGPTSILVGKQSLAEFVQAAAAAAAAAKQLREELIGCLATKRQGRCHPGTPLLGAPPSEPLHVFAASAFASLYEAFERLLGALNPPAARQEGPPDSEETGRRLTPHMLPLVEALLGCLTALLLLLKLELLPTSTAFSPQQHQQQQQQQKQQQKQQQQSPLSRGWFYGCLLGLCLHIGTRALEMCMRLWQEQPHSASLVSLALECMQLIAAAAAAAWPLQFEAHRLREATAASSVGTPFKGALHSEGPPTISSGSSISSNSRGNEVAGGLQDGVFRRCCAAPVPASGGLPTVAVCGIAAHELLLLLQLLSNSNSSSSQGGGSNEVRLWALRCLYALAGCFCCSTDEEPTEGAPRFHPKDAAAARDAALRLYPLIAATLFALLMGRHSSSNSSSSSGRWNAESESSYTDSRLPRKVAGAAALALRQWMRAALGPSSASTAPSTTAKTAEAATAAAAATAQTAVEQLFRLGASAGSRTSAQEAVQQQASTAAAAMEKELRGGSRGPSTASDAEEEEVTPQNALHLLLSPASADSRRRAAEETAKRAEALFKAPLALRSCWSLRFCRALLAVEWLSVPSISGSPHRASQAASAATATAAAATTTGAATKTIAAAAGATKAAVAVLVEGLVDEDVRVRRLSECWLSLTSARSPAAAASATTATAATARTTAAAGGTSALAVAEGRWVEDAVAFLDGLLAGPTASADSSLLRVLSAERAAEAAVATGYRLLPRGPSMGSPMTSLEVLEVLGPSDSLQTALLQAAEAAAACSCCFAPTGAALQEALRERLLAALRRLRGHARLCLLMHQQHANGGFQCAPTSTAHKGSSSSNSISDNGSSSSSSMGSGDVRGLLLLSASLDVHAAAAALRRLCRLRPLKSRRSSSSSSGLQPSAVLFAAEVGASDSALQAEPIISQLYAPSFRELRPAAAAAAEAQKAAAETDPAAADTAAAAAAGSRGGAADCGGESVEFGEVELAASEGSLSMQAHILLTARQVVQCVPPLLRGELLALLLQGPPSEEAGSDELALLLRRCEGLVVLAEGLSACSSELEAARQTQQQRGFEAWQVDGILTALLRLHHQLQQQAHPPPANQQQQEQQQQQQQDQQEEKTAEQRGGASAVNCECFYCLDDVAAASGCATASTRPAAEAAAIEVELQVLLWGCVGRSLELLAGGRGPRALGPHLPRVLVLLFEDLGSPRPSLAAAAGKALQTLHAVAGSCPARQPLPQEGPAAGLLEAGGRSSRTAARTPEDVPLSNCSHCGAVRRAEETAAAAVAAEGGAGPAAAAAVSCPGAGAKCLLQTEGSLLLDELVCRMHELPVAAFEAGDDPRAVCLLSAVVALAPPSLVGAFGALLTTLLQQQQRWVLQQQQRVLKQQEQQCMQLSPPLGALTNLGGGSGRSGMLLLPPEMPLWLLRVLAVHGFVLSSRVARLRRASYEAQWGLFFCADCCGVRTPQAVVASSLPRRRICRQGNWACHGIVRCQGAPEEAEGPASFAGGSEALATLRESALLACDEDGAALDALEAAEEARLAESLRSCRGRFGDLRQQATQVLLRVRHHLRDPRPLAAAYAHLAVLRCLVVLSTRERELLPRIHEIWPSVVPSLHQEAPLRLVACSSAGILKLLAATAGHFIRDRFAKDVAAALPGRLCLLPPSGAADSQGRSEAYKAELAVLSALAFCASVQPELFSSAAALEAALFCCIRCMHREAPRAVAECAGRALVHLHAVNPARVWLKCSRAVALAEYLQGQQGAAKAPRLEALPQFALDSLSLLTHGAPSAWKAAGCCCPPAGSAGPAAARRPQGTAAEEHWLAACRALDPARVLRLRPLLDERLAAATTLKAEAVSRCLRGLAALRLQLLGSSGKQKEADNASTA
ncbi:hypothetical protein Efla_003720 [Eimeria flavescens]